MLRDLESYTNMMKDESLDEQIKERNRLIKEICEYERDRKAGLDFAPQDPDLFSIHMHNHLSLAIICKLIGETDWETFESRF